MDTFWRAVTLLLSGLSFALIAWSVWRMRRPQPLRPITPLLAIGGATVSVFLYPLIAGIRVEPLILVALLLIGLAIGQLAVALLRVEQRDGRRFVVRSHWFMLLWGVTLVMMQVSSVFDEVSAFASGLAASIIMGGLLATVNLVLLWTWLRPAR